MYDETDDNGKRGHTVAQIAAEFGVTRPTIYRHLSKTAALSADPKHPRRLPPSRRPDHRPQTANPHPDADPRSANDNFAARHR